MTTTPDRRALYTPHGLVLRTMAKALGVAQPNTPSRATVTRFLAGERTDPETSLAILKSLLANLEREQLWPELPALEAALADSGAAPSPVLPLAIMSAGLLWDRLQSLARDGAARRPIPLAVALPPLLRLALVDLALREAAALHLLGAPEPATALPEWAHPQHRDRPAHLLRSALLGRSRAAAAKEFGIKIDTLERWVDGERPKDGLRAIAAMIAPEIRMSADQATSWLARFYGLRALRDELASLVGPEQATGLLLGWQRLTASFWRTLKAGRTPPGKEQLVLAQIFLMGSEGKPGMTVLRACLQAAPAPEWAGAMRGATHVSTYVPQLFDYLAVLASPLAADGRERVVDRQPSAALLAFALRFEDPTPMEPLPTKHPRTPAEMASALQTVAGHHYLHGRYREQVQVLERCVALVPDDASFRLLLARGYSLLGRHEEAVRECVVAGATPWLSVQAAKTLGDIHLHEGTPAANAEALRILESIQGTAGTDAEYLHNLGLARMRAAQYKEASKVFRKVLALAPHNERAIQSLANCLHRLGDHVAGADLAKEALHCGRTEIYQRMKDGQYRKRRRRRSS